jgi:Flp pilus assembly protein TadG
MKPTQLAIARRWCRRFLGVDGAAAVELAIAAPVLVLLVLGVADYGVLTGDAASLESAARAGAEVAKGHPNFTTADLTSLGLFPSAATPTVTSVCTCVDNTWSTGATCPPGPFAAPPCAGKPNPFTGMTDPRVFEYVQVTATQSFSPMVSYSSLGFPPSLTGRATIRTQ